MALNNFEMPKPELKYQFAILTFSCFYFIGWYFEAETTLDWIVNSVGFALFIVLYFVSFNYKKWTFPGAIAMVILALAIAPFNFGSNCFAIFACSFFSYTQRAKVAILCSLTVVALLGWITYIFNLNFVSYFLLSTIIIAGLTASGVFERQRIMHEQKQLKTQDEVTRLAKIAERERISQDLHDVVGHALTAIHLKAQLALKHIDASQAEEAKPHIAQIASSAQATLKEIRETLAGMQKINLPAELEAQADFLRSIGIELTYSLEPISIPPKLESDLLLIVRESATNIARHSKATQCEVNLCVKDNTLLFSIQDNGIGKQSNNKQGSGLTGIEKRVQQHGGTVELLTGKLVEGGFAATGFGIKISIPWREFSAHHSTGSR